MTEEKNEHLSALPMVLFNNHRYRGSVAASFFSHSSSSKGKAEKTPAPATEADGHTQNTADASSTDTPQPQPFPAVVEQWRKELTHVTIGDTRGEGSPLLSIGQAHPGGLAQLYAGHPTRLGNLVREAGAYKRALERARVIMKRSRDLTNQHGVGPVHIAVGHVTWNEDGKRASTPGLLRLVHLEEEDGDVLIRLRAGAQAAPLFVQALARIGISLDIQAVMNESRTVHGFAPSKAMKALRAVASHLDGAEVREDLVLGIFEHPASVLLDEYDNPDLLHRSPIIRALAGDTRLAEQSRMPLPKTNPADRDPNKELGVGDLTPRQADIVEAVSGGRSLVVDVPHGADDASLLASILAQSAAEGHKAVHIGGSPSRTARVEARLRELGVEDIAVRIDGTSASAEALRNHLRESIETAGHDIDMGKTPQMREELSRVRQALSSYTQHLHRTFRQFGVSAFDTLQVLTDITNVRPAPRTRVRLREGVLTAIARDQGEKARTLLHRAATLNIFSRTADKSVWTGIVIPDTDTVPEIINRVTRLSTELLPHLHQQIETVTSETGVLPAHTFDQWTTQIDMFEGVREVLDVFRPAIFERSAADMVIATAPKQWRHDRGISMKRSQRVRLIKQAQDFLRPGRHVENLHRELLLVQEKRDVWRKHCDADGWPVLPSSLDNALHVTQLVSEDLDYLGPFFSSVYPNLKSMDIAALTRLMDRLAAAPEDASDLPRRVAVLQELSDMGLEDFVDDLVKRHVEDEFLDAELDLAWWASVLGIMLASEPALGGFDPARLEDLLNFGRDLDKQQVSSLTSQVLNQVRRSRQRALANAPEEHVDLETALRSRTSAPELYSRFPVVSDLIPVVLTVPTLVPWLMPLSRNFDVLILDEVDLLPLAELIPIIARARQVVVVGDMSAVRAGGTVEALAAVLPQVRLDATSTRLNDQAARLLSHHGIDHSGVPIPWTLASAPMTAVWVDGMGMPSPDAHAVETTPDEVNAVVSRVIEHAIENPDQSLAVVALNRRHAERINNELRRAVAAEPGIASFFMDDSVEPFVVVDAVSARGVSRDHIIIAVGYGKTPHGRVLHDFGAISSPDGLQVMADILRTVRKNMTVVSSIRARDVDRSRFTSQGAQLLIDLLDIAEGEGDVVPIGWPVLELEPDRLLVDLADRLYRM
ncbi:MAG: prevent-host-death family protein, partial [Actinobacteria bacterium]